MKLIDAHTHLLNANHTALYILNPNKLPSILPQYFALGIHPWYLEETKLQQLEEIILETKCNILGECGLDRAISTEMRKQKEIFEAQIKLAQKLKIKKIVIHSVRSYSDILEILKVQSFQGKVILHDFNAKSQIIDQFLNQKYLCYFSLGSRLFDSKSKIVKNITQIPYSQLLLETDDQIKYDIYQIYQQAALLYNQEIEDMSKQIEINFNQFLN